MEAVLVLINRELQRHSSMLRWLYLGVSAVALALEARSATVRSILVDKLLLDLEKVNGVVQIFDTEME